jgi:hypothetical protein
MQSKWNFANVKNNNNKNGQDGGGAMIPEPDEVFVFRREQHPARLQKWQAELPAVPLESHPV